MAESIPDDLNARR